MLLEVRGQLVGLWLTKSAVRLTTIQLCQPVLRRLWHLPEVVVGTTHCSGIGKDRGGCWIEPWKVKLILD